MAFSSTESPMEHTQETQETMFESAAEFPGHDLNESEVTELQQSARVEDLGDLEMTNSLTEDAAFQTDFEQYETAGSAVAASSPAYPNPDPDPAPEPNPTPDPDPGPPDLPLTISDFAALEDRVLRAVNLVRRERQARIAAEERVGVAEERADYQEGRAAAAEARALSLESELQHLQGQAPAIEQLHQEIDILRQEREQVRQRVERLLGQLDALEL